MVPSPVADVVLDGRLITSSSPALVERGVVVAPLDPFVLRFASGVDRTAGLVTIRRRGRTLRLTIGASVASVDGVTQTLPIAPYLRDGRTIIPLGAVARALGLGVTYDPSHRAVYLLTPRAQSLATMPPFAPTPPLPLPRATFTAEPVATPGPVFTGLPHPRRTPLEVGLPPS